MSKPKRDIAKAPKWVQELVGDLKNELLLSKAFRLTEQVEKDVMPPEQLPEIVNGWVFNLYTKEVFKACTSSVSHGIRSWDKTRSQRPIALFSTEELAWRALRYAAEQEAMKTLAKIDEQIEKAAS